MQYGGGSSAVNPVEHCFVAFEYEVQQMDSGHWTEFLGECQRMGMVKQQRKQALRISGTVTLNS
jgi:hypothetical protein